MYKNSRLINWTSRILKVSSSQLIWRNFYSLVIIFLTVRTYTSKEIPIKMLIKTQRDLLDCLKTLAKFRMIKVQVKTKTSTTLLTKLCQYAKWLLILYWNILKIQVTILISITLTIISCKSQFLIWIKARIAIL
jgi:hypothetical protein